MNKIILVTEPNHDLTTNYISLWAGKAVEIAKNKNMKKMKQNRLAIKINKPDHEIFTWLLDPKNTPLWIASIAKEERSETPTKLGTIYRNFDERGVKRTYKITEFEKDKLFTFSLSDNNYHCRYIFRPLGENATELTYFEWIEKGNLEEPFTREILEKLKSKLEI